MSKSDLTGREARLAAALRANLHRRKALDRARSERSGPPETPSPAAPDDTALPAPAPAPESPQPRPAPAPGPPRGRP